MEQYYGYFLYLLSLLTMGGIYAVLTLGLNVQWGFTGLFNAGEVQEGGEEVVVVGQDEVARAEQDEVALVEVARVTAVAEIATNSYYRRKQFPQGVLARHTRC